MLPWGMYDLSPKDQKISSRGYPCDKVILANEGVALLQPRLSHPLEQHRHNRLDLP